MRIFAIIDVETTGRGNCSNRIIEISIVRFDNRRIVEKFVSLVNPEQCIPNYITKLTGISDDMVDHAPTFSEIASEVNRLTHGAIFVAHNVSFDYHVVRTEFRFLGHNYIRPQLCTLRLSKKLIPNLLSYKLENICSSLSIPLVNGHRAEAGTDATFILFKRLLALDEGYQEINAMLDRKKGSVKLPKHLKIEQFDKLPRRQGIYKFQDEDGAIIYVGKAKDIRRRVLSHFQSNSDKELQLCSKTITIDFEPTGNELVALLLEADLIKKHLPKYNTLQKKYYTAYHIISYHNKLGVLQLAIEKCPSVHEPTELFFTKVAAKERLEKLCERFKLCPKFAGLQRKKGKCNHVKFPNCAGVCCHQEEIWDYNSRAKQAVLSLKANTDNYYIFEKGRRQDETSLVVVLNGIYQGFGFFDSSQQICSIDEMVNLLVPRKQTYHAMQILSAYRKKYPSRVIHLKTLVTD